MKPHRAVSPATKKAVNYFFMQRAIANSDFNDIVKNFNQFL